MFNIREFLNDYGIPYWTSGKNVSSGWTTVSCPFCGDRSNHGGIAPGGNAYSCLKCGPKGGVHNFVHKILQCSNAELKRIMNQYSSALFFEQTETKTRASKVHWPPPDAEGTLPSPFAQYLFNRDYVPSQIEKLYGIKAVHMTGDFKYRIVIPVIQNGRVVTYVGRDITGVSNLRYKNLKEELSVVPAKECVYNIDAVHDTAIIVEGITDVWRLRYNAVAMLGLMFTKAQVRILSKKLKRAILCFDNEPQAQEMALALAEELSFTGVQTEVLLIDKKDPGELSEKEAEELRKEIF